MNVKAFLTTALSSALDLTIATPDDVVRHVTPDILSQHLPRALWARLLTACLGAAKVDAQLVVETIGVPNLCEHVPTPVIWGCLREIAQRALGQEITREPVVMAPAPKVGSAPVERAATSGATPRPLSQLSAKQPLAMTPPPAEKPTATPSAPLAAVGPNIPSPGGSLADVVAALESEDKPAASRARTPTGQRFRQSNTGIGRLAASSRRPQAAATPPEPPAASRPYRSGTEADAYDVVTEVGKDDWKNALAVEDEQLVDWSATDDNTVTHDNNDGYGRKR